MNAWKLRLIVIGLINVIIAVILLISRGFAILYIAYLTVAIIVCVIGIIWKPKVKSIDNSTN
ncbi:MAG: hypothetical protein ACFFBH_01280 [Promethearchaeota archaeon]